MQSRNLAIVFAALCPPPRDGDMTQAEGRFVSPLDEEYTLRLHEALVDPVFRKFGGRRVKQIAGTFLLAFESPTQAVLCAAALQLRARQIELDVRIGIHLGEVRLSRGDVFGEPVNIAARIEAVCAPGQVLFGESVWLSMDRADVAAEDFGERALKGVPEPVRVFRLVKALRALPDLGPLPSRENPEVRGELSRHLREAADVAIRHAEKTFPARLRVFVGAGLAAMLAVAAAFFMLARLGALP